MARLGEWKDAALKGVSAVAGLLAFIGVIYGGAAMVVLALHEPIAFSIVVAGGIVGACIYLKGPHKNYNLQMAHPETERILKAVYRLVEKSE